MLGNSPERTSDVKETGLEGGDWIYLAYERDCGLAVLNFQTPQKLVYYEI
jgi:hypothetical protein